MNSRRYENPVAVVTGGARGIGLSSVRYLVQSGFSIAMIDLDEEQLRGEAAKLASGDGDILTLASDVSSYQATQDAVSSIMDRFGRIDVLVNSAGISQTKTILEISEAEWDHVIAINLKGTFNWCHVTARHMIDASYGRIINISSVNAHTGGGTHAASKSAYAAAKAGVLGLTRGLAKELAPHVIVNAICPGLIETALTQNMIGKQGRDSINANIPMKRIGTPDDVGVIVNMLATVEPLYMTGEVIDLDGGAYIN